MPVRVLWDEKQSGETVPGAFEFMVEGEGARDVDLVLCEKEQGYLVSLTNLSAKKKRGSNARSIDGRRYAQVEGAIAFRIADQCGAIRRRLDLQDGTRTALDAVGLVIPRPA